MGNDQGATKTASIALTGSGGSGVMTAGEMFLDAAAGAGWYGVMTRSLGPQVRGGEAAAFVRLGEAGISPNDDALDVLLAFDWESVDRFADELALGSDSVVICESSAGEPPKSIVGCGARFVRVPLAETAKSAPDLRVNMVAMGILAALIDVPDAAVQDVLKARLGGRGEAAVTSSAAGVAAGRAVAKGLDIDLGLAKPAAPDKKKRRWSITGNEAAGLGALSGGIRFAAAYPITPATEILEWLAPHLDKLGGALVQAEDELASVNAVLGASFSGIPAMTATSGPGFALMQEGIGLGVQIEMPMVVVDVMRVGPSTGIPTKAEQSDLNIALYGPHGDAPHIVTAPNSPADCLFTTQWSVYLAEALQCPAIVLSDQMLGQARTIVDEPPELPFKAQRVLMADGGSGKYHRYAITETGVSPMAIPGMPGGEHEANSTEHTTWGGPTSRFDQHKIQMDKRLHKLTSFDYGTHWADIEGDGDIAVVTWGSSAGPAREAIARAKTRGIDARLISIRLLSPPQTERFAAAIEGVKRVLVVEQSHGEQFHRYLCAHFHYDLPRDMRVFNQPGPRPIRPGQVLNHLLDWS